MKIQFCYNWLEIRKNKNMLTVHKMHNAKLDIDRLYMKRKESGRGLLLIEATEVISIAEYLNTNYKQNPHPAPETTCAFLFLLPTHSI